MREMEAFHFRLYVTSDVENCREKKAPIRICGWSSKLGELVFIS